METQEGQVWKRKMDGQKFVIIKVGIPTTIRNGAPLYRNHLLVPIGKKGLMLAANKNMIGSNYEQFPRFFTYIGEYPQYKEHFHFRGTLKTKPLTPPKPVRKDKNPELRRELAHAIGGSDTLYHLSYLKRLKSTDGVKYLADKAQAYWLIDIIESYQPRLRNEEFQTWHIKLDAKGSRATVWAEDGNGNVLVTQKIPYTDFPLSHYKLFVENGIIMLPQER